MISFNFSVTKKGDEEAVPAQPSPPPKAVRRNTVSPVGNFFSYLLGKKEESPEVVMHENLNSTIDVWT